MKSMKAGNPSHITIDKTLFTARVMDGFWERWLAHGVVKDDLLKVRSNLTSVQNWVDKWAELALQKKKMADQFSEQLMIKQAEHMYRVAGLYYNLAYWIYPERGQEKEKWFRECSDSSIEADILSPIETRYVEFTIDNRTCKGRLRMPRNPKGCVIIINPLDSSKEELFTYELDFVEAGFATISYDGPGQGETFTLQGLTGTKDRWMRFVERTIDTTADSLPELPLYLFGTSSGAAWALYGSGHPKVKKTVAVSPAFPNKKGILPDYFVQRMLSVLDEEDFLPSFNMIPEESRVLLFHGKQDVMVSDEDIHRLQKHLADAQLIEYEEEGHCCNFKLKEIRQLSVQWYLEQ